MARRKKTSAAEDWIEIVSRLPWWGGVSLAIVFYLVLHRVAAQQVVAAVQPGQIGDMVTQTLWKTFASVAQYVLPFVCLVGAGVSAWRRHESKALLTNTVASSAADALDDMSWQQFEQLVGEGFRVQGYRVTETGGGGPDGGIDLVLSRDGEKHLVQCKQWRAFRVGVDVVRELYGVMAAKGAAGGFVVTSGRFTEEATNFASGRNIKLVDGPKLHGLIRQTQAARGQARPAASAPAPVPQASVQAPVVAAAPAVTPACPQCAEPMVKRTAKRGPTPGGSFWGCSGYPSCKGVRRIEMP